MAAPTDTALYTERKPSGNNTGEVFFHPEQVKYLERMFNKAVMTPSATEAEMRHYFGQQSVIAFVRTKMK